MLQLQNEMGQQAILLYSSPFAPITPPWCLFSSAVLEYSIAAEKRREKEKEREGLE